MNKFLTMTEADTLYQRDADFFQVLADPVRLQILDVLRVANGTMHVDHLREYIGSLQQPTISHHLTILRKAGLIVCEKVGLYHFYRVRMEKLEGIWPRPNERAL